MLGNRFLGDRIEHRSNLSSDMGLEGGGHTCIRLGGFDDSIVWPLGALTGVDRHAPLSLVLVVFGHNGSLSVRSARRL
ncbi:hypothetical protein GL4_1800 [Methyloceanibacter caenitepidi]|uniref:Uncharacterized protein n=1 Tax=Methyloceanibacter caenitepidi TaxID=1384459 RepID=A0A0A8K5I0_9HYPH|nr:hypothetical protein GL4_1800 [Methyloceanibacter caenitepidi]